MSLVLVVLISGSIAFAQIPNDYFSAYRSKAVVVPGSIVVPTVVDVPIARNIDPRQEFLIVEEGSGRITPSYYIDSKRTTAHPVTAYTEGQGYYLVDSNYTSDVRYDLPEVGVGRATIQLQTDVPVLASQINLIVGKNSPLPMSVSITAVGDLGRTTVRAESPLSNEMIQFIPTRSQTWEIAFTYSQPLLISEVELVEDDPQQINERYLRFLAQPGESYGIYAYPDRFVPVTYDEGGNLYYETEVLKLPSPVFVPNVRYVPADVDNDGIRDVVDNCISVANQDQLDIDRNGQGDACQDFDRDGYMNNLDNCPNLPNRDQRDEDGDGIGDVCDKEESRFTERLPWVPWAGMGIAGFVLIGLFAFVAMRPMKQEVTTDGPGILPPTP